MENFKTLCYTDHANMYYLWGKGKVVGRSFSLEKGALLSEGRRFYDETGMEPLFATM